MTDSQGVSAFPLPPMQYVNLYTDDNIKKGRTPPPPPVLQVSHIYSMYYLSLKYTSNQSGVQCIFQSYDESSFHVY